MAINLIKSVNTKNTINVFQKLRALSPLIDNKTFLTTKSNKPSLDVKQIETFDQKLEKEMKTKVLDKPTHTGQVYHILNVIQIFI